MRKSRVLVPSRGRLTRLQIDSRLDAIGTSATRFARPLRDALVVVGIGRALWIFFVQGIRPRVFVGSFRVWAR